MHHYFVKVTSSKEILATKETIINRLEYFNDRSQYLLFDSANRIEKRFILVIEKKVTKNKLTELKDIFETAVSAEEINVKAVDHQILKKIHIAKMLMVDDDYYGDRQILFVTDTADDLRIKTNEMVGFTKFKEFFTEYDAFLDSTMKMNAKSLYNIVLINKSGVCLDAHIELLYNLLSAKGILTEHVVITGDKHDVQRIKKETKCAYVIKDEWEIGDNSAYFKASDEVKLFNKIVRSNNIYITAMKQEDYTKLSALDCFTAAFPNVAIIDELTIDEKIEFLCNVANEYGLTINKEGFYESRFIAVTPVDKMEMALRKAVLKKINAKAKTFCLEISDLDTKAKKEKKISAFTELENLIGLDSVKTTIREIVTFLKRRGKDAVPCLHMAFLGNPGTGKTTVARIIARIFSEIGITKQNLLVETDRGGLVGLYVGHTAEKTANKIESALGGVLFIDEAYSLFVEDNIDYGHEAVATLVKAMEDKRDEFICILAGYTKEMNSMINMNPGLRDRIQFYVNFPDYKPAELLQIIEKLCKENKYKLTKPAKELLLDGFARILKMDSENFSNGRIVRKIFERVRVKQALRASNNTIEDRDVNAVFAENDIAALLENKERASIGFTAYNSRGNQAHKSIIKLGVTFYDS